MDAGSIGILTLFGTAVVVVVLGLIQATLDL